MEQPSSISFTDLEIPVSSLIKGALKGPMDTTWTRVQFVIPNGWDAPQHVENWLYDNIGGEWQSYNYQSPKGQRNDYIQVVRFRDRNDALMFKLRGGHQAWENQ